MKRWLMWGCAAVTIVGLTGKAIAAPICTKQLVLMPIELSTPSGFDTALLIFDGSLQGKLSGGYATVNPATSAEQLSCTLVNDVNNLDTGTSDVATVCLSTSDLSSYNVATLQFDYQFPTSYGALAAACQVTQAVDLSAPLDIESEPNGFMQGLAFELAKMAVSDFDKDGISTATDNCWTKANTDQADTDNDGVGDLCDASNDSGGSGDGGDGGCTGADCNTTTTCSDGFVYDPETETCYADDDSDGIANFYDDCPTDGTNTCTPYTDPVKPSPPFTIVDPPAPSADGGGGCSFVADGPIPNSIYGLILFLTITAGLAIVRQFRKGS